MELISREAAIEAAQVPDGECSNREERYGIIYARVEARKRIREIPSVPVVPLEPLCELLAYMYHCPSSGFPSSGHACHPDCPDEAFEKLCGTGCENYSDTERWKAFLAKWMEGLDGTN